MLRSGCEIGRFVSPVGSVILVPVGCSWHEHSVVLRVRHMFKCVFFYSRWPLSTSHLLPLVFGGGGSFLSGPGENWMMMGETERQALCRAFLRGCQG